MGMLRMLPAAMLLVHTVMGEDTGGVPRGPHRLDSEMVDAHGGITRLFYDFEYHHELAGLINLDDKSQVLAIACSTDGMRITVAPTFRHDWTTGWVLVGGARFRCPALSGVAVASRGVAPDGAELAVRLCP